MQNTDPDPGSQKSPKKIEKKEFSLFEVLDALF
jgi:hypothetical protein